MSSPTISAPLVNLKDGSFFLSLPLATLPSSFVSPSFICDFDTLGGSFILFSSTPTSLFVSVANENEKESERGEFLVHYSNDLWVASWSNSSRVSSQTICESGQPFVHTNYNPSIRALSVRFPVFFLMPEHKTTTTRTTCLVLLFLVSCCDHELREGREGNGNGNGTGKQGFVLHSS